MTSKDTDQQLATDSLMAVLAEAQQTVRSYDTKAQIVGVGYIFALGVVMRSGDNIPVPVEYAGLYVFAGWMIIVVPILMFALVLYPSRVDKVTENLDAHSVSGTMYFDPRKFSNIEAYVDAVQSSDWYREISFEIADVSKVRDTKRIRFLRAIHWAGVSFAILFLSQMLRASGMLAQ